MSNLEEPRRWHPAGGVLKPRPEVGDLVGWCFAAWRVVEITVRDGADLTDEDRKALAQWKPEFRERHLPFVAVLRHERGPLLVKQYQRLHDGSITIHLGQTAGAWGDWHVLGERYMTCSCCGHPWPCLKVEQDQEAGKAAARMERDFRTTDPGVCAGCLEPITTRQSTVTFPESSLIVPGAPGPTFHAGRSGCWLGARRYETEKRLRAYPEAARLASCPGQLFHHLADSREECTAQAACTGAHGPSGVRKSLSCVSRVYVAANEGCYPRPPSDCGYDGGFGRCLGADLSLGAPDPLTAGDQMAQRGTPGGLE